MGIPSYHRLWGGRLELFFLGDTNDDERILPLHRRNFMYYHFNTDLPRRCLQEQKKSNAHPFICLTVRAYLTRIAMSASRIENHRAKYGTSRKQNNYGVEMGGSFI